MASLHGGDDISPFVCLNIGVEFLDNMASRTKSSSGAYMSEYDTEVEKRLQALEAEVKKLKAEVASHSHKAAEPAPAAPVDSEALRKLEYVVRCIEPNFDKLIDKA